MAESYRGRIAWLGAGEFPMQGAINVDIRKLKGIDVVADARKLPFKDKELKGVASRNLIEHFSRKEIVPLLKEWQRVSKEFIEIETVDGGALMDKWRELGEEELLDGLLGAQTYDENFHKMIFTQDIFKRIFNELGFTDVKAQTFEHRGIPRIKIIITL